MIMTMATWGMDKVSKSGLKSQMLEYFRPLEETGEELIVTDDNQPARRIVPIRKRVPAATLFGDVRGRVVYDEDVVTPTSGEWLEA
jgi:antitoxin (DNA-binding transcriptional repressor) of toxin-antitoxin stability system